MSYFAQLLAPWTDLQLLLSPAVAIFCGTEEVCFLLKAATPLSQHQSSSVWKIPQHESSLWKSAFTHGMTRIWVRRANTQPCKSLISVDLAWWFPVPVTCSFSPSPLSLILKQQFGRNGKRSDRSMLPGSLYLINMDNAQGKQVFIIHSDWKAIIIRLTVVWLSVIKSRQTADSHVIAWILLESVQVQEYDCFTGVEPFYVGLLILHICLCKSNFRYQFSYWPETDL